MTTLDLIPLRKAADAAAEALANAQIALIEETLRHRNDGLIWGREATTKIAEILADND
jgi:hypothetical protein